MIYVILTACLFDNSLSERNKQYLQGIHHAKHLFGSLPNCKLLIVENNGKRETFLNNQEIEVLYTNNNAIDTNNRGIKELRDVLDAINYLQINDNDFIIKFTGRYALRLEDCPFFEEVKKLNDDTDVIIQYGSGCEIPSITRKKDCITGLIGMRAHLIKEIKIPKGDEIMKSHWNDIPIEPYWSEVTMNLPLERIKSMPVLGMFMCPGTYNPGNQYFFR